MEEWLGAATQLATLMSVLFGIYLSWQNSRKITTIKQATDGMKDALVATTQAAAYAIGKEEGRVEGELKAADLAKGLLEEKKG